MTVEFPVVGISRTSANGGSILVYACLTALYTSALRSLFYLYFLYI
jgi:hypothetical protein